MNQLSCYRSSFGTHNRLFHLSSDWNDGERPESDGAILDVTVRNYMKGVDPHLRIWNCDEGLNKGYIGPNLPYEMFCELGGYDMVVIRDIGDMEYYTAYNLVDYLLSSKKETKIYCQEDISYPRILEKCCKVVTPLGEELRLMGEMTERLSEGAKNRLARKMRILREDMEVIINRYVREEEIFEEPLLSTDEEEEEEE